MVCRKAVKWMKKMNVDYSKASYNNHLYNKNNSNILLELYPIIQNGKRIYFFVFPIEDWQNYKGLLRYIFVCLDIKQSMK